MRHKRLKDKIRLTIAAGCLLLGIAAINGCGKNSSVDGVDKGPLNQLDTGDEGEKEENSLARWKSSLQEGRPEELMAEAFRGVSVVWNGIPYFAISYEPRTYKNSFDCWTISVPYQSMAVVDTEAMYAYFRILEEMELTPVTGMTREQAGITDDSDSIFVAYYSRQTKEHGQAEPDRGMTFRFGNQDEEENYYVETGGMLWLAEKTTVERLFAVNPYEIILKVLSVVKLDTVFKVTISFGDENYEIRIDQGTFWWNEKEIDSAELNELYTELMSIFIERELSQEEREKMNIGDRELLMSVTYERNREDAPKITQHYYAYDETYASVQVNGTEFFLVNREELAHVQEKIGEGFREVFGRNY